MSNAGTSAESILSAVQIVKDWIQVGNGAFDQPTNRVQELLGGAYSADDWETFWEQGQEELEGWELFKVLDSVDELGKQLQARLGLHPSVSNTGRHTSHLTMLNPLYQDVAQSQHMAIDDGIDPLTSAPGDTQVGDGMDTHSPPPSASAIQGDDVPVQASIRWPGR